MSANAAGVSSAFALLLALTAPAAHAAVPIPGAPQTRPVAIVGAAIHPVSGPHIADGTIVFADGKIVAVGPTASVTVPADAERIDGRGKRVYPGLIDAWTQLGLNEVTSVRATVDAREVGPINPNVRAQVSFNPESELLPVTRSNGVLVVGSAPQGGLLGGQVAAMTLDGWTWEEMTLRAPVGMQMSWVLRPFLGHPDLEFTWFRPRSSSFIEAVLAAFRKLMGT